MPAKSFPKAYISSCKEDDPMIERVPLPTMGIGARNSGLPSASDVKRDSMGIKHTEDQNRK
jgi:hypothetical protein